MKLKNFLLVMLMATTLFNSCSKSDDTTPSQESLLVGRWKIKTSGLIIGGKETSYPDLSECTLKSNIVYEKTIFEENNYGTFYINHRDSCLVSKNSGVWTIDNNVIKRQYTYGEGEEELTILSLTKYELKCKDTYENREYFITYTRQ